MNWNWQEIYAIISIVGIAYIYFVVKPQQAANDEMRAENNAIHESLDKIGISIDKLTNELQASREDRVALKEQMKTFFDFRNEVRREIEEINKSLVKKCERENQECLKK